MVERWNLCRYFSVLTLDNYVKCMFHKWGRVGKGEDSEGCTFWKLGQVDTEWCSETVCRDSGGRRTQVQIPPLACRTGSSGQV